jgi:hypothetical protein
VSRRDQKGEQESDHCSALAGHACY